MVWKRMDLRSQKLTWAEIDLDAIAHNVRQLKGLIGEQVELMAVVKANAYGHGAAPVAKVALENGASRLAVNRAVEGIELRQAGITAPILILGYSPPWEAKALVRHDLTPTVNEREVASALEEVASSPGKTFPIHVKTDTGMGRFGLLPDEAVDFVKGLSDFPHLRLEGFWSHFSSADEADKSYTYQQFETYRRVLGELEEAGIEVPIRHIANSAATLDLPETRLDMVRCGITIYGLYPSPEVDHSIPLRPAMSLKSRVARVRTLPAGFSIGYGRTYTTTESTTVALVPIGYGDGYHRLLSNKGEVLIHGQRVPVIGRVCMDQLMVDVSAVPGVKLNDEVVIFGSQGEEEIGVEEVASWAETINYELVTALMPRVTRIYTKDGRVVVTRSLVGD